MSGGKDVKGKIDIKNTTFEPNKSTDKNHYVVELDKDGYITLRIDNKNNGVIKGTGGDGTQAIVGGKLTVTLLGGKTIILIVASNP